MPFVHAACDALEIGMVQMLAKEQQIDRLATPDVSAKAVAADVLSEISVVAATIQAAGDVGRLTSIVSVLREWSRAASAMEPKVTWSLEQAGLPSPFAFNETYVEVIDLERLRAALTDRLANGLEVLQAFHEVQRAVTLVVAQLRAAADRARAT